MPSLVVVGAQWGDEGKGKLVDYLTAGADAVVRFQGGSNAGHTLVVEGVTTKLRLIPSGILRPDSICVVAAGVVVDAQVFEQEVSLLRSAGVSVTPERLLLCRDSHIIMPYHVRLDLAREQSLGDAKIGTTGRGIGPCYEDRAKRCGVRVADLSDTKPLIERLKVIVDQKNRELSAVYGSEDLVEFAEVEEYVARSKEVLEPFSANTSKVVFDMLRAEKRVVFEGAQGTLLDQVHGTVPFVTSSSTLSGAVCGGVGIGPRSIDHVLGVAKAYCTRVGSGPFPTEIQGAEAERMRDVGGEYGTVTGRPRRIGWFDAVAMRRAVRLNGMDSLAITKLDVLQGIEKIRVCVKYMLDGEELDDLPALPSEAERLTAHYVDFDGWTEPLGDVRKWHHLPVNARFYLSTLAEMLGCPVSIVSVGAERSSTLFSSGASFVQNFAEGRE